MMSNNFLVQKKDACYTDDTKEKFMSRRLVRYFNFMAKIIRILITKGEYTEREFQSILNDKESQAYQNLADKVPLIFERNIAMGAIGSFQLQDLNEHFFECLEKVVTEGSIYELMLLLYYMDRAIINCYLTMSNFEDESIPIEALNSNQQENQIFLMRKTKCKWAPTKIGSGISELLYYFYYVDMENISEMSIKNFVLDPNLIGGIARKSLRIAISPITQKRVVEFSKPYERKNEITGAKQKYFRVEKVNDEKKLLEKIVDNIFAAAEKNVDILVFPEMLGTENMLKEVLERLGKEVEKSAPTLIVFPSIWCKTDNDKMNSNRSCVILNGEEVLFEQYKRCDYRYKDDNEALVYEDINRNREENNIVNVIHVEGIGRICIIICFDYLAAESRERIMHNLYPTLVCSPSFSTGSFAFLNLAGKYYSEGCNWVWCNTCSAMHETKKEENFDVVGVITTLNKRCEIGEDLRKKFSGKNKCQKENCKECIYYADISLLATQ